ncbi:MAG: peptidase [Bacteriovoracaceae bacterium]|nr:peptidase [Bacteriovoracaceae bacterium]
MALSKELQNFAIEELKTLARIPSISFPGFDHSEIDRSAEATAVLLRKSGFQNVELLRIDGCFPYIVGDWFVDKKFPTLLLYAHHDVQPPGREELWKSPPFEPVIRDGRLYGRGTADDKAGILVHAAAAKHYVNLSAWPPVNLKIIIEGEEEVGSSHLFSFLKQNRERLEADVIVVTDTGNIKSGIPSLTTSLRGLVTVEIEIKSLKAPLHSGMWGGAVVDPAAVLIKMISKLTDDNGKILLKSIGRIPKAKKFRVPITKKEFASMAGVLKLNSVPDDFVSKTWYEPSLSVNAIQASSEKLANNIICDRAYARIGIRLTARENANRVHKELVRKLKAMTPSSVEIKITESEAADAWSTDPYSKRNRWAFEAAEAALEKGFGQKVVYMGCGASIPFIGPFENALSAPVITFGVEDPLTLAHSENESLFISDFYKVIDSEIEFFNAIGTQKK